MSDEVKSQAASAALTPLIYQMNEAELPHPPGDAYFDKSIVSGDPNWWSSLPWRAPPATGDDNLISAQDSSFEGAGTGDWTPTNVTIANSVVRATAGSHSLLMTTVTSWGNLDLIVTNVEPATLYQFSFKVYPAFAGSSVQITGEWDDGSGNWTGDDTLPLYLQPPANAWATYSDEATSPAGTAQVDITLTFNFGAAPAGSQLWIDDVRMEPTS